MTENNNRKNNPPYCTCQDGYFEKEGECLRKFS